MLKDVDQKLIKRRPVTSLPMTEFARQVAPPIQLPLPLPLPLNLPLPLPLPLLAKTPSGDHAPMHSTPPTTPPTPPPLPLNMSQTKAKASQPEHSPPATPPSSGSVQTHTSAAPQDHYSLRWNNHQNHILRAFDALLQTKTLVDVTLVCAETSIRAHKMVLSACSPFFQRVFAETPCKHPVIVLKDFRGWVVQAIVDFMYRGEISVPQQRLQTLIQAGESLQVRGLVESSVPEHTPTPAASPDDFGMMDASMLSSSFEEDGPPSMVRPSAAAGKQMMISSAARMYANHHVSLLSLRRKREQECDRDLESDQELGGSSPMPRRKQARPRRRSGDVPHDFGPSGKSDTESVQTVIKHELLERAEEDREQDSAQDIEEARKNSSTAAESLEVRAKDKPTVSDDRPLNLNDSHHRAELDDEDDLHDLQDQDEEEEEQDIEELIHTTNELRRQAAAAAASTAAAISPSHSPCPSDGPEDLCTTKKDTKQGRGSSTVASSSDCESNNNNSSKLQDNNQRIMLSLKDIRQLNANPNVSQTTPSGVPGGNTNVLLGFPPPGMRPPGLPDSPPCHMDALEAQMHAAAAAVAAGEHPFHHMEHQMEMSLAAAAAAAAMHQRDPRDPRDPREHNAFASNLLGPMGMPPFGGANGTPSGQGSGPGNGCPGQAPHERLEESMNRLSKELGKEFGKDFAKEFGPSSPMSLPGHFNPPDGPPHPPSPLPFPGMSSAMTLTPPHMFGLDSPLGLFPPGIDPGKLYNPLMEMSDPREMPGGPPPFLKKKMPRPKGQHSAPRGGPPRSWTNTELTEALQHVWNKKMTTSQASRIFGIPYNSLLMYVRGKYGKSLKLEQLRKDCISGPPIEMLQMGISGGGGGGGGGNGSSKNEKSKERKEKDKDKNSSGSNSGSGSANAGGGAQSSGNGPSMSHHGDVGSLGSLDLELGLPLGPPGGPRSSSSEPDLLGGPNALFNPFNPQGFYPDFAGGFPALPLSMLNLLPPAERHHAAAAMHHLGVTMDEDCKSVGSKQSSSLDDDFAGSGMPLSLEQRREIGATGPLVQSNGSSGQD
ncbi:hypothetical protein KR018_002110 [Drosophila ironensis]|nr:hypothetical protein KR018_002110 [Drosophila ironensis]